MTLSTFRRTLLGLLLLLLFVSGCGADLASDPVPHTTPSLIPADDPTTGAIVRSTRQAQATVTRQAQMSEEATQAAVQATQTAEAQAEATATVAARATAQAIVAAKADWPSLIRESFVDNQLGWPLGLKQDRSLAVTSTIEAGRYQWAVKVDNGNSYFNLIPTNTPVVTDFVAAVNVTFESDPTVDLVAYGLTFRHVEDDYGFFGITPAGLWQALEVHGTGIYQRQLVSSALIDTRPGRTNRLEVIGRGSDFVFFINGQQVGMLSAEIEPGQIGLGVDALQSADTIEVEFTNFEVRAP
ncbi:hypothetical protein TFLX_05281 [Thermoflexales bacterium]|nr:hypothetical protein TFLX_05281 [Thermoflexales bacterium]